MVTKESETIAVDTKEKQKSFLLLKQVNWSHAN